MGNDVTVMLPSYNAGRYLKEAVQSVFDQTYTNWKLIIVDDASTDNSIDTIQKFLKDPRVTLIRNPQNLGQSKSQNVALQLVDTPYVIQLDADDLFFPNTIERLKQEADKQSEDVAVFYGNFMYIGDGMKKGKKKAHIRRYRQFKDGYDFLLEDCTVRPRFYRTSALKRVGGWPTDDPYEGRYIEDRSIILRLFEYYRCRWVDETLYKYRKHSSNLSKAIEVNGEVVEWVVREALKRWGDHYKPVFAFHEGWNRMVQLVPKKNSFNNKLGISYGGLMPKPKEIVFGGRVKLRHLGENFPEDKLNYNLMYLVSSYLPACAEQKVKVCRENGIKLVWNQNGVAFPAWAGKAYKDMNERRRNLRKQADWVIYQSNFCKMSADKFLGQYNGKFSILYNCVDTTSFTPPKKIPSLSKIRLLVMGSHYDKERVTLALDTLALLLKSGVRAELQIAGNLKWPNAKKEVRSKISSLRLDKHVRITDSYLQEDAPKFYRKTHILLHFKYNDPSPTVPIEAMACGIPVIGSRSGGMTELLGKDGGTTLEVPFSWEKMYYPSAKAAADAVTIIMKDWKAWSSKARKRAVKHFSKEKWLKEHKKIFSKVVESN
ncbi:glycosyltransferase [Paenibacillus sedimenti]|uniref:Glycosyltransferase n=1 Tax=Paenibacillus sedimenti TaxID=2770274 RepID=A0A926KW97_9BACL|nr:glycosyltransferase [Paenibacillus sedimenti]MBD0384331.1 glycosyltransferase [Paenibacillus sedimenti]